MPLPRKKESTINPKTRTSVPTNSEHGEKTIDQKIIQTSTLEKSGTEQQQKQQQLQPGRCLAHISLAG